MDDERFQQELQALKQRVWQFSSAYTPMMPSYDPFVDQLGDLKAELLSMQGKLTDYLRDRIPQTPESPTKPDSISAQMNFTLPSGPLFWELFQSLRSDMDSMDSRVATLETTLSDLEDRVDKLEPTRFTPPESTDGADTIRGFQFPPANTTVSTSPTEVQGFSSFGPAGLKHYQPSVPGFAGHGTGVPQSPVVPYMGIQNSHTTVGGDPTTGTGSGATTDHPTEPLRLFANYDGLDLRGDIVSIARSLTHIKDQNHEILCKMTSPDCQFDEYPRHATNSDPYLLPKSVSLYSPLWSEHVPSGMPRSILSKEPTLRDEEITRMNEQLLIAQKKLETSERNLAEREETIDQLRMERGQANDVYQELVEKSRRSREKVAGYAEAWRGQQDHIGKLMRQVDDNTICLREAGSSYSRLEKSYEALEAQLESSRMENRSLREHRKESIQNLRRDHEARERDLQELCDGKDATLDEQEYVIKRNAKALVERDLEIEQLHRQIQLLKDRATEVPYEDRDYSASRDQGSVLPTQVYSRDSNDSGRRHEQCSDPGCLLWNGSWDGASSPRKAMARGRNNKAPLVEVAYPAWQRCIEEGEAKGSRPTFDKFKERDSSVPGFERSSEVSRTARWGERYPPLRSHPASDSGDEGSSQSSPLLSQINEEGSQPQQRHRGRIDYSPMRSQTSRETYTGSSKDSRTAGYGSVSTVRADSPASVYRDTITRPPLPGPVMHRRMSSNSISNLRRVSPSSSDTWTAQKPLSKHQSMQGLRRRRLQAYVEDDDEVVGGLGGEV